MKRFVCVVLSLLLLNAIAAYGESSNTIEFDSNLTDTLEYSAEEFMASGLLRASATIFLTLDMAKAVGFDDSYPDIAKSTFVGRDGNLLYIFAHTKDGRGVFIGYIPSSHAAMYTFTNDLPDVSVKMAMTTNCPDGYYKNDDTDIYDVWTEVQKMLGN